MRFLVLIILGAVALSGCKRGGGDPVGNYTGRLTNTAGDTLMVVDRKLELRADHTYTFIQHTPIVSGTWAMADGKITLTPKEYTGPRSEQSVDPRNKEMIMELEGVGNELHIVNEDTTWGSWVYVRDGTWSQ